MEVRIGVQNVGREISFETNLSAEELIKAVKDGLDGQTLELTDDKGGHIIVPSEVVGYVTTGAEKKSGVGFGVH